MRPEDLIENKIRNLNLRTSPSADRRILAEAQRVLTQSKPRPISAGSSGSLFWRLIMKNTGTKLTSAAVIFLAVGFMVMTVVDKFSTPAYALEQTIQASHSVRYLHIKSFEVPHKEPKEFWMEFDKQGNLARGRVYFPAWGSNQDGRKVVVWKNGVAQVWFMDKKTSLIINDQQVAERFRGIVLNVDPKDTVKRLQEEQKAGKLTLEIQQPSKKGQPIVLVATDKPSNKHRKIFYVDPDTKLVMKLERYDFSNNKYVLIGWDEFLGYNKPIPESEFTLKLPPDTMLIDQTKQDVGLQQGSLTNDEIAQKVAREFFEALIAKDYAKAGKILGGMPVSVMEKHFTKLHVLRIISVGKPEPHPQTRGLRVPVVVELEKDGKKVQWSPNGLFIRQVYNQPRRWEIIGGI